MSRINQRLYLAEFKSFISAELCFRELMLYAVKQCQLYEVVLYVGENWKGQYK